MKRCLPQSQSFSALAKGLQGRFSSATRPLIGQNQVGAVLALWLTCCAALAAQQAPIPTIDALGGHPYSITKTWIIGGSGNWDTLTMDPTAGQLFIAHGPSVQVVDVSTGAVVGTVLGFHEAHAIVLDDAGEFGYASDGPADLVRVFDRRSFKVVANIPTGPRPRALALDPQTGLLLAICSGGSIPGSSNTPEPTNLRNTNPNHRPATRGNSAPPPDSSSVITVIDPQTRQALQNLTIRGILGLAQPDQRGHVYVAVQDRNQVARIDVQAISTQIRNAAPQSGSDGAEFRPALLPLPSECRDPRSVAVDGLHQRLFVACNNMKMAVVNGATGESVTSLTIGPGAQAIAYDAGRGLIFTDSYSVVQNLPTLQEARTLAINPSTGEIYLVTALYGVNLDHPPVNGLGTLKMNQVDSSFQVLVIGN
jgi:DNA-binding beta-propeller fold protein YncE